jgi:hypothetical protein
MTAAAEASPDVRRNAQRLLNANMISLDGPELDTHEHGDRQVEYIDHQEGRKNIAARWFMARSGACGVSSLRRRHRCTLVGSNGDHALELRLFRGAPRPVRRARICFALA